MCTRGTESEPIRLASDSKYGISSVEEVDDRNPDHCKPYLNTDVYRQGQDNTNVWYLWGTSVTFLVRYLCVESVRVAREKEGRGEGGLSKYYLFGPPKSLIFTVRSTGYSCSRGLTYRRNRMTVSFPMLTLDTFQQSTIVNSLLIQTYKRNFDRWLRAFPQSYLCTVDHIKSLVVSQPKVSNKTTDTTSLFHSR